MTDIQERLEKQIYDIFYKASRISDGVRCINEDELPLTELASLISLSVEAKEKEIKKAFIDLEVGLGKTNDEAFNKWISILTIASLSPKKEDL